MDHRQTGYRPNNLDKPILIGDAAAWLKVSVKTLRRWEDHGLIKPKRNSLNQRLYSPEELKSLRDRKHKPINNNQVESFLTISEVATALKVTVKTIRRWDEAGRIESSRNRRNQRVFSPEAVEKTKAWLEQRQGIFPISISRPEQNTGYYLSTALGLALIMMTATGITRMSLVSPTLMASSQEISNASILEDNNYQIHDSSDYISGTPNLPLPTPNQTALRQQAMKLSINNPQPLPEGLRGTESDMPAVIFVEESRESEAGSRFSTQLVSPDKTSKPSELKNRRLPLNSLPFNDLGDEWMAESETETKGTINDSGEFEWTD